MLRGAHSSRESAGTWWGRVLASGLVLLPVVTLMPAVLIVGGAANPRQGADHSGISVSGRVALQHIEFLSAEIGPRVAGSPAERTAAAYIETAFRDAGYAPSIQPFALSRAGQSPSSRNVLALKAGRSSRQIIIGAHYDSQRRGPGADDNASGVGVLLEVASALRDESVPYTLRFVAFGAEEGGLRGARHFVSEMAPDELLNTIAMINLDSLGAGDVAYVYGSAGERGRIRDWILERATEEGLDLRTQDGRNPDFPAGTTCACSDHSPFDEAGIQYAYFESTNWELGDLDGYTQVDAGYGEDGSIWHTPFDTLDYIDASFPGRMESRLALFSQLLYAVLTEYEE